jgi:hypothetical protein
MHSGEGHKNEASRSCVGHDVELAVLQEHHEDWRTFATGAVRMFLVFKAQMAAVTQETERAAAELILHL